MSDLLAKPPTSLPTIELPRSALALAAVGGGEALVEGTRACVELSGTGGRIDFDGVTVVEETASELGTVANSVVTHGLVRRERVGPRGVVTETVLVAPAIPLAWLQWSIPPTAASSPIRFRLAGAWEVAEASGTSAVLRAAPDVGPAAEDLSAEHLLAAWLTGPAELSLAPGSPADLVVRPRQEPDGPVTLALACGNEQLLRGARSASAHPSAHAVRAASESADGVVLRSGVAEIDEGVAWARARLRGIAHRPGIRPHDGLLVGLAALAVGDPEAAGAALASLASGSAEEALLAARLAAATGDPGPARACADAMMLRPDGIGPGMGSLAAEALADGLRYAAPESTTSTLRRLASELRARSRPGRGGGRSLPMAGVPPAPPGEGAWLGSLLAGRPERPPLGTDAGASALREAAAAFVHDPDDAWSTWRVALGAGLDGGPVGPGSWDARYTGSVTAELLLTLAHGVLGLAQDAPVGRMTLAPRLPTHVGRFDVEGLPLGESRIAMSYRREGRLHRFEVSPTVAAVPPLLVFEPSVRGSVAAVRVDDRPAELDVRTFAGRSTIPVQLPIDGVRSVEVVTEEP